MVTHEVLQALVSLGGQCGLRERIDAMFYGEKINVTEDRAALHVARHRRERGRAADV